MDNSGGHFGVTIRGGTVREFSLGVLVDGGTQNRIHHLAVSDHTEFGIIVQGSVRSAVEHNRMVHTGISGILLVDSTRSRVASNSVSGSQGFGIVLAGVKRSLVQSNRITGNDHGIAVQAGSSHNAVRLNLVSLSGGSAIDVGGDGAVANRVELNRLIDNGDGIVFGDSNDSVIEGNLVTGSGTGQPDAGGFGVRLDGSDRNIIRLNVVTGGRGPAITITSEEAPTPAESNVVSRNVANSTDADGITIDQNATQTLIVRNIANSNGDDGIDVKDGSAKLTRNTAYDNHDLGIEAVPGVTDGGGNRANGNGNPAQCINIDCSNG